MYYPHAEYLYLELTNDKIDTNGSQMIRLQGFCYSSKAIQGHGKTQITNTKFRL